MPRKLIDLTGKQFGMWTVLEHAGKDERKAHFWLCQCECGQISRVKGSSLKIGDSTNCGCRRTAIIKKAKTTHGHYGGDCESKTHRIWNHMIQRCTNPNNKDFKHYGGRGILLCDRWLSFELFLEDMGECPKDCSIERRNVNGNYEPGNCEWIPLEKQARNKRNSILITYQGETRHLKEWCEILDLDYRRVVQRISTFGWSPERAFTEPSRRLRGSKK